MHRVALALLFAASLLGGCAQQNTTAPETKHDATYTPPDRSLESMDNSSAAANQPLRDEHPGMVDSSAPPPAAKPASADEPLNPSGPTAGGRTYVVKKGDTLAGIARKMYGDSGKWKKIHDANKVRVPDPKKLKVGTKLVIP